MTNLIKKGRARHRMFCHIILDSNEIINDDVIEQLKTLIDKEKKVKLLSDITVDETYCIISLRLSPEILPSELVRKLKTETSKHNEGFSWKKGYCAVSNLYIKEIKSYLDT